MGKVKFTLAEPLYTLGLSGNKFSQLAKVRSNTIYDLINDISKEISKENLEEILNTLNEIAKDKKINKTFDVQDIVKYIEE